MSSFFNVDGPLFSGLDKVADLFWLNVLFLICCIPIVTIGASSTALYYVTLKMVKNEESGITKSFFRAFRTNFKQSTIIWLFAMVVGFILGFDYLFMTGYWADISTLPGFVRKGMLIILLVAALWYLFTLRYVFPLLARFDNTIRNTIKNSFLISIRHLPYTILLFGIVAAAFAVLYFFPKMLILCFIILFSLVAYLSSYIFVKIFAYYMPKEEEKDPDAFVLGGDEPENAEEK